MGSLKSGRGKTDEVEDGETLCHRAARCRVSSGPWGTSINSRNTVESTQLADTERGDDDTKAVLDSSVAVDGIGRSEFVG